MIQLISIADIEVASWAKSVDYAEVNSTASRVVVAYW